MDRFRPLSRPQIARIVNNDPEAIKAFEKLFNQAGVLTPDEIATLQTGIDAAQYSADGAQSGIAEAMAILQRLDDTPEPPRYEPDANARLDYLDLSPAPHVSQVAR